MADSLSVLTSAVVLGGSCGGGVDDDFFGSGFAGASDVVSASGSSLVLDTALWKAVDPTRTDIEATRGNGLQDDTDADRANPTSGTELTSLKNVGEQQVGGGGGHHEQQHQEEQIFNYELNVVADENAAVSGAGFLNQNYGFASSLDLLAGTSGEFPNLQPPNNQDSSHASNHLILDESTSYLPTSEFGLTLDSGSAQATEENNNYGIVENCSTSTSAPAVQEGVVAPSSSELTPVTAASVAVPTPSSLVAPVVDFGDLNWDPFTSVLSESRLVSSASESEEGGRQQPPQTTTADGDVAMLNASSVVPGGGGGGGNMADVLLSLKHPVVHPDEPWPPGSHHPHHPHPHHQGQGGGEQEEDYAGGTEQQQAEGSQALLPPPPPTSSPPDVLGRAAAGAASAAIQTSGTTTTASSFSFPFSPSPAGVGGGGGGHLATGQTPSHSYGADAGWAGQVGVSTGFAAAGGVSPTSAHFYSSLQENHEIPLHHHHHSSHLSQFSPTSQAFFAATATATATPPPPTLPLGSPYSHQHQQDFLYYQQQHQTRDEDSKEGVALQIKEGGVASEGGYGTRTMALFDHARTSPRAAYSPELLYGGPASSPLGAGRGSDLGHAHHHAHHLHPHHHHPSSPDSSTDNTKNICGICGKTYARPSTLKTHLRTHSGERPYRCYSCDKSFSQAANLTAHCRTHSGEKPFHCSICNRKFSQSSSVTTHMRTHSGERPYRCRMCKKAFSDSSTLTKHLRIHSGEKPYQCKLCHLRFSQSGNLNRHMRIHAQNGS